MERVSGAFRGKKYLHALRYDLSVYVLASFSKKNKHTIIPKHHVTIDAIDEHNGTLKSSGFIQSVRIIAEGTQAKCQERATQYSRSTGSEEVEIQPINQDEDNDVDNNHMYTSKSFHDKDDNDYLPPTTDFISTNNGTKLTLDFSLASRYKHNRNSGKHVISDDDDEIEEEETIHVTRGRSNTDCPKNTDDSPAAPLVIDEHSSNDHNTQENRANVLSNVNGNLYDISERDDDDDDNDDDLVLPQVKPMKKKRKTASRPKQSTSNEALVTEVSNIHKEFLSFRYNIEQRIKSLEKTFRILKNRKVLKERNDLMNIDDSPLPLKAPDLEVVLGIDVSKFRFGFDEHTKFVRQIFRQAQYAFDPNLVLSNDGYRNSEYVSKDLTNNMLTSVSLYRCDEKAR
ncbi:unnamed protein product [Rotaria socialis]|uniref:Uncharacterized protein n=1 Tax=Rotaria socialis TaxID=392032 RepID=A0A817SBA5_9BILA|nr:unnamed protein product [Rotaria socialis]